MKIGSEIGFLRYNKNMNELYEDFFKMKEAIDKDLKIDRFHLEEAALKLPSVKHFWVAELIRMKIDLKRFQDEKGRLARAKFSTTPSEIGMSRQSFANKVAANDDIMAIDKKIKNLELCIEYLEKVEKIFSQATFDIKNVIELIKAEQM